MVRFGEGNKEAAFGLVPTVSSTKRVSGRIFFNVGICVGEAVFFGKLSDHLGGRNVVDVI